MEQSCLFKEEDVMASQGTEPEFAAFVAIDWADKIHYWSLRAAGSNQINSVGFAIKDPTALLTKARELAVADAIARAQTYAKAAGVTLGPILSIQEGFGETPRPLYNAMVVTAERVAPTPVAPGEQSVTANVTVIFQIK